MISEPVLDATDASTHMTPIRFAQESERLVAQGAPDANPRAQTETTTRMETLRIFHMTFKGGLVVAATMLALSGGAMAADPRHPVIAGYGAIAPMPKAKERPDRSLHYRVLFSVTKAAASPDQVNPNLEKVARFVNLLGADGVRPAAGDVAVVIHGPATALVMNDADYGERTRIARNPNLPLVAALRASGVSVRVCSQALVGNKIDPAAVEKGIEIDVSALTTMATLQLRGWALIPD